MTGSSEVLDNKPCGKFLCGVVEGFYGIPWTSEQRKLLFKWMDKTGMNTYMYAPKDDAKHRAFWRELYSVEEADNLTSLIEAAAENNVTFVYAISPGLDISFSSSKDVQCLKRKLEQVAAFGCNAFALLFDDIDPELSISDKSVFQSSACAQVSITNEVYEYLGQPEFYFCPTEYCATRALPTLATSDYMNTVGSKLLNAIHVLWTGSKVISKKIYISEMEEVSRVLQRPPVIWDNIHANDYDQRRVFLGPYDGRSPELIPYLRGVLTNPNCEFEANYIPLHTLGQWAQSNIDGVKKDIVTENRLSPVAADIKLENENDYMLDEGHAKYHPKHALKIAIADWLEEFKEHRNPPKSVAVATQMIMSGPPISTPPAVPATSVPMFSDIESSTIPSNTVNNCANPSFLQPQSAVLVNSLVDPLCSPERKGEDSDSESDTSIQPEEPMDCVPSAITDSLNVLENDTELVKNTSSDNLVQMESVACSCPSEEGACQSPVDNFLLTQDDLDLLISLFYLPSEYGAVPTQLLTDLHWLKFNAFRVVSSYKGTPDEVEEWWERSNSFQKFVDDVLNLCNHLKEIPNQAINYYFYPYLWDMLGVLQVCSCFVKWLGLGLLANFMPSELQGPFTWMTKDYRESFLSGDQEPWCFQGGLQAEFQRMLPVANAHDLLYIRHPEHVLKKSFTLRPYKPSDEESVYNICLKTSEDGMDGSESFPNNPQLAGDSLVGPLITLSPEFCMVAEDELGVMGYALAALDYKQLQQKQMLAWVPAMQEKYQKPQCEDKFTVEQELMEDFYAPCEERPAVVTSSFPSVIRIDVLSSRMEDLALSKRLLACSMSALKAKGSPGAHVQLKATDKYMQEHYRLLGFIPIKPGDTYDGKYVYMGRVW